MRRLLLLASLVLVLPAPAEAAGVIASCGVNTPRIAPPPNIPIPPTAVPNWAPYDPVEGCFATVNQATAGMVTALINPDDGFVGIVGLRVRGPNALFAQYEGTFVNGTLVSGEETRTFSLSAGTWQLEVYLGGPSIPSSGGMRAGSFSVGRYYGSLSG